MANSGHGFGPLLPLVAEHRDFPMCCPPCSQPLGSPGSPSPALACAARARAPPGPPQGRPVALARRGDVAQGGRVHLREGARALRSTRKLQLLPLLPPLLPPMLLPLPLPPLPPLLPLHKLLILLAPLLPLQPLPPLLLHLPSLRVPRRPSQTYGLGTSGIVKRADTNQGSPHNDLSLTSVSMAPPIAERVKKAEHLTLDNLGQRRDPKTWMLHTNL